MIHKGSHGFETTLVSVEGLCGVTEREVARNPTDYIRKIQVTATGTSLWRTEALPSNCTNVDECVFTATEPTNSNDKPANSDDKAQAFFIFMCFLLGITTTFALFLVRKYFSKLRRR
ncbi:hypothetical protein SK128_003184 [Halocaridina rubra]|uniref:Uncharacterized protein n=1 Tax=Halocaridina rubra TaxID=373956 RepID=A0AAN8XUN4_HALRR